MIIEKNYKINLENNRHRIDSNKKKSLNHKNNNKFKGYNKNYNDLEYYDENYDNEYFMEKLL